MAPSYMMQFDKKKLWKVNDIKNNIEEGISNYKSAKCLLMT